MPTLMKSTSISSVLPIWIYIPETPPENQGPLYQKPSKRAAVYTAISELEPPIKSRKNRSGSNK
jgi:hypothetical protein